jgi:hypothetical protein
MTNLSLHIKHVLLGLLIAGVLILGLYKIVSWQEGKASQQKVLAEEQLKNDLAIAKVQAANTATDTTALQQQIQQLSQSNQQLAISLASLKANLSQQQQKDATATPSDLSLRWRQLAGTGAITPQGQALLVDMPAAHATVSQLEQLPVLQAEIQQTQATSSQKDLALTATNKVLGDTQAQLVSCQKVAADSDAVCKAEIAQKVAAARKHGIWAAVGSFIGGILLGRKF